MTQNFKSINYVSVKETSINLQKEILSELNTRGFVIINNFNISNDLIDVKNRFLQISNLIGIPIGHDLNNKIIWDIKLNNESTSFIKTYSEHSHEAELHTDSQYSEYPEDFFTLLTLKKAQCGGGLSTILKLEDVLIDLRNLKNGKDFEKVLRETNYPFIVPNVFKKKRTQSHEFNFGPILRDNEIRFRIDTFEKALEYDKNLCTDEQILAYKELKKIILNSSKKITFFLEEGDLIFINNKTTLHGRSSFKDINRHLLRIRLNKK